MRDDLYFSATTQPNFSARLTRTDSNDNESTEKYSHLVLVSCLKRVQYVIRSCILSRSIFIRLGLCSFCLDHPPDSDFMVKSAVLGGFRDSIPGWSPLTFWSHWVYSLVWAGAAKEKRQSHRKQGASTHQDESRVILSWSRNLLSCIFYLVRHHFIELFVITRSRGRRLLKVWLFRRFGWFNGILWFRI